MPKPKEFTPLQAVFIRERLIGFLNRAVKSGDVADTVADRLIYLAFEMNGAIGSSELPERPLQEDEKGRTFKGYDRHMLLKHNTFDNFLSGRVQKISASLLHALAGFLIESEYVATSDLKELSEDAYATLPVSLNRSAHDQSRVLPASAEYYCRATGVIPLLNWILIAKEDRISALKTFHVCQFAETDTHDANSQMLIRDLRRSDGKAPAFKGFIFFDGPNEAFLLEFLGRRSRSSVVSGYSSSTTLSLMAENDRVVNAVNYQTVIGSSLTPPPFYTIMYNNKFKYKSPNIVGLEASMSKEAFDTSNANFNLIEGAKAKDRARWVKALVDGADVNYASPEDGNTLLHWIAKTRDISALILLIRNDENGNLNYASNWLLHAEDVPGDYRALELKWVTAIKPLSPLIQNAEGLFPSACIEGVMFRPPKDNDYMVDLKRFFDDMLALELAAADDAGKDYDDLLRKDAHPFPNL